jgi:hypothetical protein
VSVDRSAKLEPVGNSADTFQLIGPDGAGGAWWFEGLKAGKYTLAIAFDDSSGDTRRFVKPVADTATTPFLTCKAATRELTFEIVIGEQNGFLRAAFDPAAITLAAPASAAR